MTERFGIQDHGPQITQHALQNPTNPGHFDNIGAGDNYSAPRTISFGPIRFVPRRKIIPLAAVLGLIFGPLGLSYAAPLAGVGLLLATLAADYFVGGGHATMDPVWFGARAISAVWAVFAAKAYNAKYFGEKDKAL